MINQRLKPKIFDARDMAAFGIIQADNIIASKINMDDLINARPAIAPYRELFEQAMELITEYLSEVENPELDKRASELLTRANHWKR